MPVPTGRLAGGSAYINQARTRSFSSSHHGREIRQLEMQTADNIHAGAGGFFDGCPPTVRYFAADRCNADDEAFHAGFYRFSYGHIGYTHFHIAAWESVTAPPPGQAATGQCPARSWRKSHR